MIKYWNKLMKWIKNATIADIVCHTDSDGLTAAAQLSIFLKSRGVGVNMILGSPERLRHANFWRKLKNDLVFFVDIPADQAADELIRLSNKANIVIIDHHKISRDMNSDSIIHYHREFLGVDKYYPSSKQVYDLFGGVDWMACIGLIGDYGGKEWKDFINSVHKRYGFPPCRDENCFDSPFAKYDQLISSARMARGDEGCLKVYSILVDSKDWEDFKEKATALEAVAKRVNDYIEHIKADYEYNKEVHKKQELVFYELVNPKYRIGSALATIISTSEPHRTIIMLIHKDPIINVNLRRQDGAYDMSKLAKECATEFGGAGGGHRQAAGATISAEHLKDFKECVMKKLDKWVNEKVGAK